MRAQAALWPGSVRLLCCAAGLWACALLSPEPWALLGIPVLGFVGIVVLRRHHHLGVGILVFTCLLTIQITALAAAHGPDAEAETTGLVVGHSEPGASGWTRLTLVTRTGFTHVLSPETVADGARVRMHTARFDDIRSTEAAPHVLAEPNRLWRWRETLRTELQVDSLAAGND